MKGEIRKPHEQVGHVIATRKVLEGPKIGEDPKPILEGVGHDIHLVGTKFAAHPDVVFAPDHVERIRDMEDVGTTLERGKSAIAQTPVSAAHDGRGQATADAKRAGLRRTGRSLGTLAVDVGGRNVECIRLAASVTKRANVVEDPVIPYVDLVDAVGGKDMSFGEREVPTVVLDVLRAREGVRLSKSRRTTRQKHRRLVVTEPSKQGVLAREVVIKPDVEFVFGEFLYWGVNIVPRATPINVRFRKQINHLLSSRIP